MCLLHRKRNHYTYKQPRLHAAAERVSFNNNTSPVTAVASTTRRIQPTLNTHTLTHTRHPPTLPPALPYIIYIPRLSSSSLSSLVLWPVPKQDPLDQIHEPDGNQPTEVGPTGSDDARSQGSSYQGSTAGGGDRRSIDGAERSSPQQPPRPEVLYLEKGVPLRDSIMWKLQR